MKKYGVSITNLLGSAGPDKLVGAFAARLGEAHGMVRLHFYPFGGIEKTAEWISGFRSQNILRGGGEADGEFAPRSVLGLFALQARPFARCDKVSVLIEGLVEEGDDACFGPRF